MEKIAVLTLLVVFTMLHEEPKFPLLVRWLIFGFGCIVFVTFPQLPDELMMVAIVLPLPLPDFPVSVPSESITMGRGSDGSIKLIVDLCPLFPELFEPLFTSRTREITLAVGGDDCCDCC